MPLANDQNHENCTCGSRTESLTKVKSPTHALMYHHLGVACYPSHVVAERLVLDAATELLKLAINMLNGSLEHQRPIPAVQIVQNTAQT